MKNAVGIGMILLGFLGSQLSVRADDRNGSAPTLAEVGVGAQAVASGFRFLVAVGSSGIPVAGLHDAFDSSATANEYLRRGVRLFWVRAQLGFSDVGSGLPFADIEVLPVSYEEAYGRRSRFRVVALPVQYQREIALGVEHRLSAYLIGVQAHGDLQDADVQILGDPVGTRSSNAYVDFAVHGLGALFTRFANLGEGAGISVGSAELGLGMSFAPMRNEDSGWVIRAELMRTRLALDFAHDMHTGGLRGLLQWEVMARLSAGHRWGDSLNPAEVEFFVHGGLRGTNGIPGLSGMSSDALPGTFTPVIEAGVMGRF
jgi:hypothetical protein